ncbi:lytic transglycosylase domain-containing protein [Galbitalea sp. SE-J8]|uniref:lytic transglycosylase domain-containing protein n=1 Tax=Galbitalea sp. SE-J8 TaxID=3054952 RepID=UPI00259C9E8D|nr:lytic transglycosylase domain-containing protein [Galbitalea sp. SE-J8]MDM4762415.1 lytic transglycosylase domain-containing protein [Galbitalea sp. SE-J8]
MPARPAVLLAIAGIAFLVAGVILTVALAGGSLSPRPAPTPEPSYARPAAPPAVAMDAPVVDATVGTADSLASVSTLVDPVWLATTSARTGIPARALAAYAGAAIAKARAMPQCGISWNTLAAIGWVESKHGTHGGSRVTASGAVRPAIYGPSLTGDGTEHIPDSDDGRFDRDKEYDRAMGPMQLIPQTWRNWRTDGSGDGKRDPQNIDDATMAAANYLCRATQDAVGEPDMVTTAGWQGGIRAYNPAPSYLHAVARAAIEYGR